MKPAKSFTAIKAGVALTLFWMSSLSWSAPAVGAVVQLNGPLMVRKADGTMRVLSRRSVVESGDTLVTEKNTYAMVKFIDDSEITLKPSTTFTVADFSYDADKPDGDKASFILVNGGLRSVTGLLGKRNKDKFEMKTPSASIGVRGTTFLAAVMPPAPGTAPGLHLQVIEGAIVVSNGGGAMGMTAGQFGYVPSSAAPPVVIPQNPGLQFTPPPAFNVPPAPPGGTSTTPPKSNAVDCIVR